jgi:uncharacterized membrane protein
MDIWPSTAFLSWKQSFHGKGTSRLALLEAQIRKVKKFISPEFAIIELPSPFYG